MILQILMIVRMLSLVTFIKQLFSVTEKILQICLYCQNIHCMQRLILTIKKNMIKVAYLVPSVSEVILIVHSDSHYSPLHQAQSGNIGKGPIHQSVQQSSHLSICQSILVHFSMMAGWIFFILGTRYHGPLIHIQYIWFYVKFELWLFFHKF